MRAWMALAALVLALVLWATAGADMTVLPNNGATGLDGRPARKIGDAYPLVVFAMFDTVSTVDDQYTGDTPTDSAYADTIGVARDWDWSGDVDSSGVGEWTPIRITVVEYCGLGPDTLWMKGLGEDGGTLWLRRFIPPTNTARQCYEFSPILAFATRIAVFTGRANLPSVDDWTVTAYASKD